ncbi:Uncharacterised protein [Streptococcus suis]|nr:Uncharacterised protein [Streptococcus suis]CYU84724.1 Uncharacterised protein [Streptococcus suis]
MTSEKIVKIGRATYAIVRKFVGKDSLEKKIQRLILSQK